MSWLAVVYQDRVKIQVTVLLSKECSMRNKNSKKR